MTDPRPVAILGGTRIPFCRSHTAYKHDSNQDMMTAALTGLVHQFNLRDKKVGDVALGSVIKHSRDWNLARESVLGSGLAPETPAFDVQRACGTSLEAASLIANKIALGQIDVGIAGGTDTVSDTPVVYPESYRKVLMKAYRARSRTEKLKAFVKIRPKHFKPHFLGVSEPRTGLSMGESTELMAKEWGITRVEQDKFALASHQKAAKALNTDFFNDLITPYRGVDRDNNVRANSGIEKLLSLKTVFDKTDAGTLTAGNSTPLTDGASCALFSSVDWAMDKRLPILAYLKDVEVAAVNFVNDEGLLMAPAYAVSNLLKRNHLRLQDFDYYEIHEAFAAQVLCTLKAWESPEFCHERLGRDAPLGSIDPKKMNVMGGSLAIGHPFAATGTRLVATLAKLLNQKGSGRGLISVCTAGGMGIAAIVEAA